MHHVFWIIDIAAGTCLGTLCTAFLFKMLLDHMNMRRWEEMEQRAKLDAMRIRADELREQHQRKARAN
jgi:hypothetical protein